MKIHATATIAVLILMSTAQAIVWYVHPDSALNSIQTALNSCSSNDTVLVGPGTYFENIHWPTTQGIDLISEFGAGATIIDGDSLGAVIYLGTSVDTTTKIRGFTIKNGFSDWLAGGICCDDVGGCSPYISHNIITDNRGYGYGGGITCASNDVLIIDSNTICNNTCDGCPTWPPANGGAGIYTYNYGGFISITGNMITNNYAEHCGGGIRCSGYDTSSVTILRNNNIQGNTAEYCGAGIYLEGCSTIISNCSIINNTSNNGCGAIGIYGPQFVFADSCAIIENTGIGVWICSWALSEITFTNCEIFSNSGYGMFNDNSYINVNAEHNWWGDATGPYHPTVNPNGLGDTVTDDIDFDPWLLGPGILEYEELVTENHNSTIIMPTILKGTTLPLTIRQRCEMSIKLYDLVGRECWSAERKTYESGSHKVNLPKLANGIYFITFGTDEQRETRKLLFVR